MLGVLDRRGRPRARRGQVAAALSAAGALAVTTLAAATPAHAVPAPPDAACPAPYPVSDLVPGAAVDGLTVSRGNTPEVFTGEVLGVLADGIAPGRDMIVARLTSSEIDRVGGIWSGMSGSPVYAADGRLVGAVAYGLSYGSSPVAGITPAADMRELLSRTPGQDDTGPAKVTLPMALRSKAVAAGATQREASSGLERLQIPIGISGMSSSARLTGAAQRFGLPGTKYYRAAAAPSAATSGNPADIFAGSNLAASLSYGDVSAVAVGTTTMVCDGVVIGFGHPFEQAGDSSYTMHGAQAVYIQEDSLDSPFKAANATGPVGVIDQDRGAGIRGVLGNAPAATRISTVVDVPSGASRLGISYTSVPDVVPDVAALGLVANMDRVFDKAGKGSSYSRFTVTGRTAAGTPFQLNRQNRFADNDDITYATADELYAALSRLQDNDFTDVTIDQVQVSSTMSATPVSYKVGQVQVKRKNGTWRTLGDNSTVKGKSGQRLILRVTLKSAKNRYGSKVVTAKVRVPKGLARRTSGELSLGRSQLLGLSGEDEAPQSPATSFAGLLKEIASSPRNDQLDVSLGISDPMTGDLRTTSGATQLGDVITDSRTFQFMVSKKRK